jgi:hypothetical protein
MMRGDAIRALLSENRGSEARKSGARLKNTKILWRVGELTNSIVRIGDLFR